MAEEKKNRSEELESLDKKINEIINGFSILRHMAEQTIYFSEL